MILGTNLGYRLYPLQHYEYRETNKQKIGLDIVMDYINVVCKQICIGMFVSRTKWQMQSGVKSGANTLYGREVEHKSGLQIMMVCPYVLITLSNLSILNSALSMI